jgi:hypothetical protein
MALSKNYLQLEFGSGKFFEYSKEEKDGYVKHTSTKNNVSWRKYSDDGVSGTLESVSIYDGKFGQQISLNIKDGEEIYYVPIDIYDQSKQVDNTYAESLIKLLPQLEKGQNITITGYNFKPDDSQYSKIGVSIKVSGEKLKSTITNSYYKAGELVAGDIPPIVWVEKLGKKKPSAASIEAKDEYLLDLLVIHEARLTWKKEDNSSQATNVEAPSEPKESKPTPVATPAQAFDAPTQQAPVTTDDDDDDLPF